MEPWHDHRPSGHYVTVGEWDLTKLPDPNTPTPQQILDAPMGPNDIDAQTVREYLAVLLATVWREEEGFDGKRPFGNSGWQHDLCHALAASGYVELPPPGMHGYEVESCVRTRELVAAAIKTMREPG